MTERTASAPAGPQAKPRGAAHPGAGTSAAGTSAAGHAASPFAFAVATLALVLPFAAAAAPIPLYGLYEQRLALAAHDLSIATLCYFAGTIVVILTMGRLSTYLGRRPVIWIDLALCALGCVLFASVGSAAGLYAARFVQGLSCGIAAGCAGAFAVDTAPAEPAWAASAVSASGPQVGFAIGAVGSALTSDALAGDTRLIFAVMAVACAACAALVAACRETMPRTPGALRSLVPRVSIGRAALVMLPACAGSFMGAWGMSGFYQTFSSIYARLCFGATDAIVGALVFTAYMAPGMLGGPASGRFEARRAVRVSLTVFAVAIVCVALATQLANGALLIIATLVAGVAQAAAYSSALSRILQVTTAEEAAGTLSCVTLVSYIGALVPNVVIGALGAGWTVQGISVGYAVLVCAYLAVTLLAMARERE